MHALSDLHPCGNAHRFAVMDFYAALGSIERLEIFILLALTSL
jgi:hypothetical protein